MKKLLITCPHLSTGGLPQWVLKQIQLLRDTYKISVIEYNDITGGVFVVQRDQIKALTEFYTLGKDKSRLLDYIDRIKPDIIHLAEIPEMFMDMDLAKKIYTKKNRNYFVVETTHDSSFDIKQKYLLPDKFVFVSPWSLKQFESLGVPMELVEYPIEIKERPERTQALQNLGLDPEYKHVLNVGLWSSRKNQGEIIEYAKQLQDYKIKFHFVGNQAENFKGYWEPLMKDLPENCVVWGERKDTDNFYSAMDCFLFTSLGRDGDRETNPLVIKEALGWQMPTLIYPLHVYLGMYDQTKNVDYLKFDDLEYNKNKILEVLMLNNQFYKEIFADECYKKDDIKIESGDIVVDLGSNVGIFIDYALKHQASKVYGFEILNENIEKLSKKFKDNSKVTIIDKGISNVTSNIVVLGNNENNHFLSNIHVDTSKCTKTQEIETIVLDDFVEQNNINKIDFLKFDIEGSEYKMFDVIKPETLKKIHKITGEYHWNYNNELDSIIQKLKDNDFDVEINEFNTINKIGYLYAKNKDFQSRTITHFYQNIHGWFDFEDVYSDIVSKAKENSHFVEVGTWLGKSSAFFATEIHNSGKNIKLDCIDTFEGTQEGRDAETHKNILDTLNKSMYETFLDNISPVKHIINPIIGKSSEIAKTYKDNSLDFVFLDAGHEYQDIKIDIKAWLPKIKDGGILAGHDYYTFEGVTKAVDETLDKNNINVKLYTWIYTKKQIQKTQKVYDCFMFFNELDLLEIRLNILDPYVDKFVIVESQKTHSGKEKPLYFEENKDRFKKWEDRIIHLKVDLLFEDPWDNEKLQRDLIKNGLKNCSDNDIVMISDLDEIPNFEAILDHFQGNLDNVEDKIYYCQQNLYYYYLNLYCDKWTGTYISTYRHIKKDKLSNFRDLEAKNNIITNGGWHWGYLESSEAIKNKIDSFAHVEYQNTSLEQIQDAMSNNKDMFGRTLPYEFKITEIDDSYPQYIRDNLDKYEKFIKNDELKIAVFSPCINEAKMIKFYLDHYLNFIKVDKIFVYDGGSTDGTLEILSQYEKVEVIKQNHSLCDERDLMNIRNEEWKKYKDDYDFVIVCDIDEFLYHDKLREKLKDYKAHGITIPRVQGFDMISKVFPSYNKDKFLFEQVQTGIADPTFFNKNLIFNCKKVEINYGIGCHSCNPTGDVKFSNEFEFKLLHFKKLSYNYLISKTKYQYNRLAQYSLDHGFGIHNKEFSEYSNAQFVEIYQNSKNFNFYNLEFPKDLGRDSFQNTVNELLALNNPNPVIVEVGSIRTNEHHNDGWSTLAWAWVIKHFGGKLYVVDINREYLEIAQQLIRSHGLWSDNIEFWCSDGIEFFDGFEDKIDLLYLDAWDYDLNDNEIKAISESKHLECFQKAKNYLNKEHLIFIDDIWNRETFEGKGKLLIPHLLENNYEFIIKDFQCLFKNKLNGFRNKGIVVSRYHEDVSWLNDPVFDDFDKFVYDKSIQENEFIKLPNVGREAQTYLYHILNHYDILNEHLVFTQGNPFDHCPEFIDKIRNLDLNKDFYEFRNDVFESDAQGLPHQFDVPVEEIYNELTDDPFPDKIYFIPSSIFKVSSKLIRESLFECYNNLMVISMQKTMAPWAFERLWRFIFTKEFLIPNETHELIVLKDTDIDFKFVDNSLLINYKAFVALYSLMIIKDKLGNILYENKFTMAPNTNHKIESMKTQDISLELFRDDKLIYKKEFFDLSNDVIIISTHPSFEAIEETTKQCIEKIRRLQKPIILVSHVPVSKELQDLVDYTIYDRNNPIIKHTFFNKSWLNTDEFSMEINLNKQNNDSYHGLGVLLNYYNGISFAKNLGFKNAICMNFDLLINNDDLNVIKSKLNLITQEQKLGWFMQTQEQEGNTLKTLFFIINCNLFMNNFSYFASENQYNESIRLHRCPTNSLENYFYYVFKDILYQFVLENINEQQLFPKSNINLFSLAEYLTLLPIKDSNDSFMLWFSSNNKVDSRKFHITIFEDDNQVYNEIVDIRKYARVYREIKYNFNMYEELFIVCELLNAKDDLVSCNEWLLTKDNIESEIKDNGLFVHKSLKSQLESTIKRAHRIKVVHLLTRPEDKREKRSIESLQHLRIFGLEYKQEINEPYTQLPPSENCLRPQDIGEKPGHMILSPGHYGCYLAHRNGILNNISDDIDALIICECDCIIASEIEKFIEKVNEAYDICLELDAPIFSFGSFDKSNATHVKDDVWKANKFIEAHCYLITRSWFERMKDILEHKPWDVADLYLTVHIAQVYGTLFFEEPLCHQAKGVSLIDKKMSDINYLGIPKL